MLRLTRLSVLCAATLCTGIGTATAAPTNFELDVETAIDRGLANLVSRGSFNDPSTAGSAAGLTTLALLEKRPPNAPDQAPLGYAGASADDQARIRTSIRYILKQVTAAPFDTSYRDGAFLMAVSVYLRSGGPDRGGHADLPANLPHTLKGALDTMFDRIKGYQRASGYWCYGPSFASCDDSSTTQFVMAGLAALRAVYGEAGKPYADATRLAQLNDMTKKARDAYVAAGTVNLGNTCGTLDARERAHGYNKGSNPTLQQTASGSWIQLVGGVTVNDASVQGYLRWLTNRYRYSDLGNLDDNWPSYWYYMWSSAKAYFFIKESRVNVAVGNINPVADIGKSQATDAPACVERQQSRNPANDARIASFGPEPAGHYAGHPSDFYYDYAYTLMSFQCANGSFTCNGAPGDWNANAGQAYALLVLLRSVGGGCIDIDKDGICDASEDAPPQDPGNELTCDVNNDSKISRSDLSFIWTYGRVPGGSLATGSLAVADLDGDGRITVRDFNTCLVACLKSGGACR